MAGPLEAFRWMSGATRRGRGIFAAVAVAGALGLSSCTLLSHSPRLIQDTRIAALDEKQGIFALPSGRVPYQRWRVPGWDKGMRYVWMVGDHDFRTSDRLELVLFFHGMHSKDYYRAFRGALKELALERRSRPFLFVGFVDEPFYEDGRSSERWKLLSPGIGERPDRLMETVNAIFKGVRRRFPHVDKRKTSIVLAGFSGGGKVLNSVGNWLARSPKDDPYARVFLKHLSKIVYFDCWFDPAVLETVPALLESNPSMKIVGTVHMDRPKKHADMLADKLNMKPRKHKDELVGLDGRFMIFHDKSHWEAIISRLRQALDA
ncbi:MAG: hypothetical protein LDL33_11935 [Desulfomonile sp.]|nr:hypothetical protein [Desulfomonile sp.]